MADSDQYTQALLKLCPTGKAWPTESESNWYKLLEALAQELMRIDTTATDLLNEIFPDTTTQLLPDWERVAGLPDPCSGLGATIAIRRKDLLAKITARGGQSPQYFIDVAAQLGYEISITEFDPFQVDISSVDDGLYSEEWQLAWQVNSALNTIIPFVAGGNSAGDALRTWGNERLECIITARKPAHTILLFAYL
jgi:uncharacterized protein YmfQ (DUF2313 family)